MKKVLSFILSVALLLSLVPIGMVAVTAKAASGEQDGFTYEVHDGKATVTGYLTKDEYYIDIPRTVDGYPVVSIGASAFESNNYLLEVYIPEGVQTIESRAFWYCKNLQFVDLPDSLITIGDEAFSGCSYLQYLEFGDNLKSIGYAAFSRCYRLPFYLDFPKSLESIGMSAFYYCTSLEMVILPESLRELGTKAFALCSNLHYFYLQDNLTRIGSQVLYGSAYYYDSNNWNGDALYAGFNLMEARKSISGSYTILQGIKNIAEEAFKDCSNLTEVVLPDALQIIGANAFDDCYNLQSITIPSGVTTIGDKAFYGCRSATEISLPDSVVHLGQDVFTDTGYYKNGENWVNHALYLGNYMLGCNAAIHGTFEVQQGTKIIAFGAMKGQKNLKEVILPDTLIAIDTEAFADCSGLTKVNLPGGVTTIGERAFFNCTELQSLHFGKNVSQIDTGAFGQCASLETITVDSDSSIYRHQDNCLIRISDNSLVMGCKGSRIPDDGSVTTIGPFAFEGCEGLTEITIPDTITTIGEGAFQECDTLKTVKLGNGVQVVGQRAFADCNMLSQVDLGQSVHTIDDRGFAYNHRLTHIDFPASLRYLGTEAFSNGTGIVSLNFREGLETIGTDCFYFCESLTELHLPDSLKEIKDGAFYYCEKLAEITFGEGLGTIGSTAFSGCMALETLVIPANVKAIGSAAFYDCQNLQQVDLGNVETIGYAAFENCRSLTRIHIPASVTTMGGSVFAFCPALEQMTVSPQNPYYHSRNNCIIETAEKTLAFGCKNSTIPHDGSVISLDSYSFAGCSSLKSIVVPDQVEVISAYTFYYCSGLEFMQLPFVGSDRTDSGYLGYIFGGGPSENDLYVPSTLKRVVITSGTKIGDNAFSKCSGLEEIMLPESTVFIGYDAFANCSKLMRVIIPGNLKTIKEKDILVGSDLAILYISAGQEKTIELLQSMGLSYNLGGLITFLDEEGQCMDRVWYLYGKQIATPDVPEKPADDDYTYTVSWKPAPGTCTGNQTIQLRYTAWTQEGVCAHINTEICNAKNVTCTEDGYTGDTCCVDCGENFAEGEVVAATGHNEVVIPGEAATCTESGRTDSAYCSTCNETLQVQQTIAPLGHTEVDGFCTVCGNHTHTMTYLWEIDPTCTAPGLSYGFYCKECGEILVEQTELPPKGHNMVNGRCTGCFLTEAQLNPQLPDEQPKEIPFTDVPETEWYRKSVEYVYEHGLMNGMDETTYAPEKTLTRAMLVTILYRMAGSPTVKYTETFTDVPAGQWYSEAILWGYENDIVRGMGKGLFAPDKAVTREQMVTFLYRYASYAGYDESKGQTTDLSYFADAYTISNYAYTAFAWAVGEGVVNGMGKNNLNPLGTATRAQVAKVIMQLHSM